MSDWFALLSSTGEQPGEPVVDGQAFDSEDEAREWAAHMLTTRTAIRRAVIIERPEVVGAS